MILGIELGSERYKTSTSSLVPSLRYHFVLFFPVPHHGRLSALRLNIPKKKKSIYSPVSAFPLTSKLFIHMSAVGEMLWPHRLIFNEATMIRRKHLEIII